MSTNPSTKPILPPVGVAISGAIGAVLANGLIYPLDIIKTRIQVQEKEDGDEEKHEIKENGNVQYNDTLDAFKKIIEQEGIAGLYAGITGSLFGVAITNFAYFYCYSVVRQSYLYALRFRKIRSNSGHDKYNANLGNIGTIAELALGAVAAAMAQLFTTPVSVITTRQQTERASNELERKGFWATGLEVIRGEGNDDKEKGSEPDVRNLWKGLKASLILVINPSITYGAYQRLQTLRGAWYRLTESRHHGKNIQGSVKDDYKQDWSRVPLSPKEAFLFGSLSKSIATLVTHPLIIAKVCMQSGKSFNECNEQTENDKVYERSKNGMKNILEAIYKQDGWTGLYRGLGPQLLKGILVQGIMMMMKERVERFIVLLYTILRRYKANLAQ